MAASAHTMSGSRFLRPKLSRFFNQVAQARRRISRIVKGAAALMPPMPEIFSSRFFTQPRTPTKPLPLLATENAEPLLQSGRAGAPADLSLHEGHRRAPATDTGCLLIAVFGK